ncbi:unnamed protein product [Fusarium graminearum]|nr:unnamed protein product [Fusarium graminearum]
MDAPPTNESTQTLDKSIQYLIQHLDTCSVLAQADVDLSTLKDKTELPMTYALLCMLVGRTEMLNERVVNDNQDAPLNPYTQREHYLCHTSAPLSPRSLSSRPVRYGMAATSPAIVEISFSKTMWKDQLLAAQHPGTCRNRVLVPSDM